MGSGLGRNPQVTGGHKSFYCCTSKRWMQRRSGGAEMRRWETGGQTCHQQPTPNTFFQFILARFRPCSLLGELWPLCVSRCCQALLQPSGECRRRPCGLRRCPHPCVCCVHPMHRSADGCPPPQPPQRPETAPQPRLGRAVRLHGGGVGVPGAPCAACPPPRRRHHLPLTAVRRPAAAVATASRATAAAAGCGAVVWWCAEKGVCFFALCCVCVCCVVSCCVLCTLLCVFMCVRG